MFDAYAYAYASKISVALVTLMTLSGKLESTLLCLPQMTANNGRFSWRSLVATGVVILIFAGLIALTRKSKAHARANAQDVAASLEQPYGGADRTAVVSVAQSKPARMTIVRHW